MEFCRIAATFQVTGKKPQVGWTDFANLVTVDGTEYAEDDVASEVTSHINYGGPSQCSPYLCGTLNPGAPTFDVVKVYRVPVGTQPVAVQYPQATVSTGPEVLMALVRASRSLANPDVRGHTPCMRSLALALPLAAAVLVLPGCGGGDEAASASVSTVTVTASPSSPSATAVTPSESAAPVSTVDVDEQAFVLATRGTTGDVLTDLSDGTLLKFGHDYCDQIQVAVSGGLSPVGAVQAIELGVASSDGATVEQKASLSALHGAATSTLCSQFSYAYRAALGS